MTNLLMSSEPVDFWVWINPDNWLVRHQITVTGGFTSGGLIEPTQSNLIFIPNPDFRGELTPFQHGVMRDYMSEYNLELSRLASFNGYPSRLNAIYLFPAEEEARKYSARHRWHVGDRILKKCRSVTPLSTLCTTVVGWISCASSTRSMPSQLMKSVKHIGVADTLNITNWNLWECSGRKLPSWRHSSLGESSLMTERLSAVVRRRQKTLNQMTTIAFTVRLKPDTTATLQAGDGDALRRGDWILENT